MKGHVTFLWFSANNDTFLYEHVLTVRGHFLNYPFIHMKLKLGAIVDLAIVTLLLEHSQLVSTLYSTSCHTSVSVNMSFRRAAMWRIPSTPAPLWWQWFKIISMSSNLKSLSFVKTLIFFSFNITVLENRKMNSTIFSKAILLVIIL